MWIITAPDKKAPATFCVARAMAQKESACKPGSVESHHSSGTGVTAGLEQPTRKARGPRVAKDKLPWTSRPSLFGLAPDGVCRAANGCPSRGALLPHHFTLASVLRRFGGLLSVALSVGSRRRDVISRPARWSPDFPPACCHASGRSANSAAILPLPPPRRLRGRRAARRSRRAPCAAGRSARPRAWPPSRRPAPSAAP